MRSKSPIRIKRSRSSSSNRGSMKDAENVIHESTDNQTSVSENQQDDEKPNVQDESAIKIHINDNDINDTQVNGTVV